MVRFFSIYVPKTIFYFNFRSFSAITLCFLICFFIINNPKTIFANRNSRCFSIFSVISFFTLCFLVCFFSIYVPKTIFYFYFGSNSILSYSFFIRFFIINNPKTIFADRNSWCYSIFSVISFFALRFLVCFYIIYIPKTIFYFNFRSFSVVALRFLISFLPIYVPESIFYFNFWGNSVFPDSFFIRFFIINNPKTIFADGNGRSIKNCFLVCPFPIDSPISIFDINFWSNSIFTINTFKVCYGLSPISVVFWSIKVK